MKEYIEREEALMIAKILVHTAYTRTEKIKDTEIEKAINDIPAADVRPVVKAVWKSWEQDKLPFKWYSCDYCGFHALSRSNYCPNCGADMRGEEEHNAPD